MNINDLEFELTCGACPEQYDVYCEIEGVRCQVGYVRLRGGVIRCDFLECGGDTIYRHSFEDGWKGCFDDEKERWLHLSKIADILKEKIKG